MAAGAAMSMASVAMNAKAAADQKSARAGVIKDENNRQRAILQRSRDVFDQTLPQAGATAQAADRNTAGAARLGTDMGILSDGATAGPTVAGNAPLEVQGSVARSMRNALAAGQDRARRNAAFGAYTDANNDLGVRLGRAGQWQSIFGNEAQRSAGITPLELEDANSAGSGFRLGGGILGGLGQAAMSYGMNGFGGGAGSVGRVDPTAAGPWR
jgi:hypothetical protein